MSCLDRLQSNKILSSNSRFERSAASTLASDAVCLYRFFDFLSFRDSDEGEEGSLVLFCS